VLINLLPEFLAILDAPDRRRAWQRYHDTHRPVIDAYWRNYVMDPDTEAADDLVSHMLGADRRDLWQLVAAVDVVQMAEDTLARAADVLQADRPVDCYLMVGMGAANAGELVVNGRGVIFICLEHFTGRPNPDTFGLGLTPDLIPLWIAHEYGHLVRYLSPDSKSDLRRFIRESGGNYDVWTAGSRATLRELLVNEGLAVRAAEAVAPGFLPPQYFGYAKRQYNRLRELESFLRSAVEPQLDRSALGLRLRYLVGGISAEARTVDGKVLPERSGYYLGHRLTEAFATRQGIGPALRASVDEFRDAEDAARRIHTA
jgi:hypothetical protein